MITVVIRTIVLYFIALTAVRIMGKSELSKMSPFQMVILFMIAELATFPIDSPDIPIATGAVAILSLISLQIILSFISIKSEFIKNIMNGKPSILIKDGAINYKELYRQRITINDLTEQLRLADAPSLTDVEHAIMESNGNLSVILKPGKRTVTYDALGIESEGHCLPFVVVSDGHIYKKNLLEAGHTEESLQKFLRKHGVDSADDAFIVFSDENRKLHIYKKDDSGFAGEV